MFYLIRHAAHDNLGSYLAGRTPGIHLGEAGRSQAGRLGERLSGEHFDVIHASPRERTVETAQAVANARGMKQVETYAELDEIDFGHWSGRDFDELGGDPLWRSWNAVRSLTRTPAGESMLDVQVRILRHIEKLRSALPDGTAALVSHADVIKSAVLYFLGLPIDAWPRFDIATASITRVAVNGWGAQVLGLNEIVA